jgi:hypothetical protein
LGRCEGAVITLDLNNERDTEMQVQIDSEAVKSVRYEYILLTVTLCLGTNIAS